MFVLVALGRISGGESLLPFQAQEGSPALSLINLLVSLAVLVLAVLGARSPYKAMRIQARVTRAMTRLHFGPDWESTARWVSRREYLEYVRIASDNPEAFPARAAQVRVVLVMMAAVAALVASGALLVLVAELKA